MKPPRGGRLLARTVDQEVTYAWLGSITRVEKDDKDPNVRYVWGKATDGSVDTDEQIVDPKFAQKALADWYETGANVRQMHATTLPPAGKGVLLEHHDGDGEWVRTKVVEPVAVKLVDEGVYTGYSVGIARPRIDRDMKARGGRIVGGKIVEISLVDRPALPTAKFAVLKAAGTGGSLEFVGKVVTLGDPERATDRAPRTVKQLQRRMHVTAHVLGAAGLEAVEGLVVDRSRSGFTLDVRGYDRDGGDRAIAISDVVAIYKGSVPVTAALKAAGVTHAHSHPGPDGVEHDHEHSHAHNHGDHSVSHAHGHSTEESVADDQKPQDAPEPAEDADAGGTEAEPVADDGGVVEKAACSDDDHDFDDAGKCGKCGTMKAAEADTAKAADAPVTKSKGITTREVDGKWFVTKGSKVLSGPFADEEAATADRDRAATAWQTAKAEKSAAAKAEKAQRAEKAAAQDTPYALKRLHDAVCGVYSDDLIKSTYATDDLLGKSSRKALEDTLVAEIKKGGKTDGLVSALAAFNDLRKATKRGGEDVLKAIGVAHADLHTVFKMANGLTEASADGLPKPGDDAVQPGKFTRGYIRAGHQDAGGSGHGHASIPDVTHPVHASDFGRGPLTEGHQRYLSSKVADLHDGLSSWQPELCRMDSKGSMAFDRQNMGGDPTGNARDGMPFVNAFKAVDNHATATPQPTDPGVTRKAPGEKSAKAAKHTVKQITADQIQDIVHAATQPLINKISSMQGTIDAMAAAPDLSRSASRGVTGYPTTKIGKADTGKAQKKSGRSEKKAEKIEFMRSVATAGDPAERIEAQDWLASRGIDA